MGWRLAFGSGAVLGLVILYLRRFLPESPRWLMLHGQPGEAARVVDGIEARIIASEGVTLSPVTARLALGDTHRTTMLSVARTLLRDYPGRTTLGLVLMAAQAFIYNAIFFTYALVLTRFYGIEADKVGSTSCRSRSAISWGRWCSARCSISVGRKTMIFATYGLSGLLLALTGWMFAEGMLTATTQTAMWSVVFFFASAAASAAYLTVGECFPLEIRALTIALFYAFGTLLGGVGGPWLFGVLIASESPTEIVTGYMLGAFLMIVAALVTLRLGVKRRMPAPGRGRAAPVDARRACRSARKAVIIAALPSSRRRGDGMTSDELTTALGQAAAKVWGQLPAYIQHDLFEAAARSAGKGAREELAVFLHRRHPRTTDGEDSGRRVPEPDSLGG